MSNKSIRYHWTGGLFCLLLIISTNLNAQIKQPIRWEFSAVEKPDGNVLLNFVAGLDEGWHIYAQNLQGEGPVSTKFTFEPSADYGLVKAVSESGTLIEQFDPTFSMPVKWYEHSVTFTQEIKLTVTATVIRGAVEFMVCNEYECLPPEVLRFSLAARTNKPVRVSSAAFSEPDSASRNINTVTLNDDGERTATDRSQQTSASDIVNDSPGTGSLWTIFITGFLGGLAALIMPCIFPMIPFTVGMFSRQRSPSGRITYSIIYGVSIILIYVSLGLLITVIFGSDALNALSTNGIFNFTFFLLLTVFAASFLGAFELSLPATWANKVDRKADRGGYLGIFFAALTLALVSFSCTGPIIGTLLVQAASANNYLGPLVGMSGFSLALALPFTFFSFFPSFLNSLPKSGHWLLTAKITLGFLELALALKFLSNVDLAYHWQWFDRELFLVLWIIIFGCLGFYLLGKLTFIQDPHIKPVNVTRLFAGILVLAFTLYMVPGLWGAPLKAISAFLPPQQTQDFDLYSQNNYSLSREGDPTTRDTDVSSKKYADIFEAPLGLDAWFDYEQGLNHARRINKPVMIDFTGHACVNCRKMESNVWSEPEVLRLIKEEYVLIQLYVDDKLKLPENERYVSGFSGKDIITIGSKWSDFQATRFSTNSQPYYVLLDPDETNLVTAQGADYDPDSFKDFLESGLAAFNARQRVKVNAQQDPAKQDHQQASGPEDLLE